ncbi:hypothetical protein [Desulfobacterium sp. N47]|uniref:Uncharacterized protein n=1 Tax=uncultured Desulfobacterium sp. TaxID=201089 RepID=E1YGZ1_9BACT|nr:hypothetical protein N47_F15300 [uncultured Desulfobacterium sp.]
MKIIDKEVIKNGEQDLIDSINGDLDWGTVEEIFRQQHRMNIGDDIEYKQGDIVVYNDQVAYRLEFDVKVNFTVLLDRQGNCLLVKTPECEEESGKNLNGQNTIPDNNLSGEDNHGNVDNYSAAITDSSDKAENQDTNSIQQRIEEAAADVAEADI